MLHRADIRAYDGCSLTLQPSTDLSQDLKRTGATQAEIRLLDPRCHSTEQRGKVFALCTEIAEYSSGGGHDKDEVEYIRKTLMRMLCASNGVDEFSMSDVDMTTCSAFISYLVDFCLEHNVPTLLPLINHCDSIERFLWGCLYHRRCAVCGADADVHHLDAVGMGRGRRSINHVGMRAIALCRVHHTQAHKEGVITFFTRHKLHGIRLDEKLCDRLNLNREEEADEQSVDCQHGY